MTPEQAAAYINAQAALFLGELELIKAQGTFVSITPPLGNLEDMVGDKGRVLLVEHAEQVRVHCAIDPDKLKELLSRYDTVLSHNAVLTTFGHANEPGMWGGPR